MNLITAELKQGVQRLFKKLSTPNDPSRSPGPSIAETRMTGPQASEAKWPNFTLISDEPQTVGGGNTAPAPSSIFVASIAFAENVIFARQAALQNVEVESYETRVEAQWDRRGLFGIDDADPSITDVLIVTRISTSASGEKAAEMLKLTHKRSPLTATMAKACTVRRKLFVNGTEVPV